MMVAPEHAALSTVFDGVEAVVPVGYMSSTWYVETSSGRMVAKRMEYDRDQRAITRLLERVGALPSPPCPRLLATVDGHECWYAVFEYIDGVVGELDQGTEGEEAGWRAALNVLTQLAALQCTDPSAELVGRWLRRLERFSFFGGKERELLRQLTSRPPSGPHVITHGDFSVQNFCYTARGLVLLDWEFVGVAPAGFDAGWLMAHNRIGGAFRRPRATLFNALVACGFDVELLKWYEGLGLLRMLYRSLTLPIPDRVRCLVARQLRITIEEWLTEN